MNDKMMAQIDQIRDLQKTSGIKFQKLKNQIKFGDFTMDEIINMYAALTHELDNEEIVRIDSDTSDGVLILEQFGWE